MLIFDPKIIGESDFSGITDTAEPGIVVDQALIGRFDIPL